MPPLGDLLGVPERLVGGVELQAQLEVLREVVRVLLDCVLEKVLAALDQARARGQVLQVPRDDPLLEDRAHTLLHVVQYVHLVLADVVLVGPHVALDQLLDKDLGRREAVERHKHAPQKLGVLDRRLTVERLREPVDEVVERPGLGHERLALPILRLLALLKLEHARLVPDVGRVLLAALVLDRALLLARRLDHVKQLGPVLRLDLDVLDRVADLGRPPDLAAERAAHGRRGRHCERDGLAPGLVLLPVAHLLTEQRQLRARRGRRKLLARRRSHDRRVQALDRLRDRVVLALDADLHRR
eukprot:Unigene4967_Nuclearia_a/m.15197 Unigene4967_Nuclearia_a/g.15197  ORF Unigene4967_Nuclearia_a/g.15197 Unigene4967_Nuclearia_a/m.15197 type:complete len:300 (-) Unigene4967_Nuclearia_a:5619-6518(-)